MAAQVQAASGAEEPSPAEVVAAAESLVAEIGVLREALGVRDYYPDVERLSGRAPVHVYAKTLEVLHKVRRLQAQLGLAPAPPRQIPAQSLGNADVFANFEHLIDQVLEIKAELDIDVEAEPAPPALGATLSTAYERLAVASLMLDGLRGGPLSPTDLFQVASAAFRNLEAIAGQFEAPLNIRRDVPENARPVDIANDLVRLIEKVIDVQENLGMAASTIPGFTPVRVTASEIYDLTGTLVAELALIKQHEGIAETPLVTVEFGDKTLRDFYARIQQVEQGIDQIAVSQAALVEAVAESDDAVEDQEAAAAELPVPEPALAEGDAEVGERAPEAQAVGVDEVAEVPVQAPEPAADESAAEAVAEALEEAPEPALAEGVVEDEVTTGEEAAVEASEEALEPALAEGDAEVGEQVPDAQAVGSDEVAEVPAQAPEPAADESAAEAVADALEEAPEPALAQGDAEVGEPLGDEQGVVGGTVAEAPVEEAAAADAAAQPADPAPIDEALEPEADQVADTGTEALPPSAVCAVVISDDSQTRGADYPRRGRRDFGDASILVAFEIDENGDTVDDKVEALIDQSTATRQASINLFADAATDVVKEWRFEFEDAEDGQPCKRRQVLSIRFNFAFGG